MLNFKESLAPFALGRRVNSEEWNAITRTFEAGDDTTRLPFGSPVKEGTGKHTAVLITVAAGENLIGIVEAMPTLPRPGDGYARYDNMPICNAGVIAVATEGNTTKGAQARWNTATSKFTAAAQSSTVLTLPGITFEETATAPGIAPVRVRLPNPATTVKS